MSAPLAPPTFDPGFTTVAMTGVFSPATRVAAMLEVEGALAMAQATAGLVPGSAAAAIVKASASLRLDADALLASAWDVGTPTLPLVEALRGALDPESARWVHHGATTQDIVDTALVLQARRGLDALAPDLVRMGSRCRALAFAHRSTPVEGRTFLQPAAVTTFGRRAAGWWVLVDEAARRVAEARASLPVQIGGPVGQLAGFGAHAGAVRAELARALGLRLPAASWHADRQPMRDLVSALGCATAATAKVALDVVLLAQAEIAEVRVRGGRSSSMPHKSNPIDAMRALAAAEASDGVASIVSRGSPQALERGFGAWHAEAFAIPLVFHTTAAALEAAAHCLGSLEPDAERMASHLTGDEREGVEAAAAEVDRLLGPKS